MEGNASRRELLENIGSFVDRDDFGLEGDIEDEVFDCSPSITLIHLVARDRLIDLRPR